MLKTSLVFPFLKIVNPNEEINLSDSVSFNFFYASHILGACSISLTVNGEKFVFSGDVGQDDDVLMFPPVKPKDADETQPYHAGRGAQFNTKNRFLKNEVTKEHIEGIDEWEEANLKTQYIEVHPKTIVNKVESPDVGMSYSMNPYAGCEHGCIYCYARPSHAWWDFSPGLDFETQHYAKTNAADLLRRELAQANHQVSPIALGVNTDAYQPCERQLGITRQVLQVLQECRHPRHCNSRGA